MRGHGKLRQDTQAKFLQEWKNNMNLFLRFRDQTKNTIPSAENAMNAPSATIHQ